MIPSWKLEGRGSLSDQANMLKSHAVVFFVLVFVTLSFCGFGVKFEQSSIEIEGKAA